jgi:hypothetical protein
VKDSKKERREEMKEKTKSCRDAQEDLAKSSERMAQYLEDAMKSLKQCKVECKEEDWELLSGDEIEQLIEKLRETVLKLRLKIS